MDNTMFNSFYSRSPGFLDAPAATFILLCSNPVKTERIKWPHKQPGSLTIPQTATLYPTPWLPGSEFAVGIFADPPSITLTD
jgi:hypothetical protein